MAIYSGKAEKNEMKKRVKQNYKPLFAELQKSKQKGKKYFPSLLFSTPITIFIPILITTEELLYIEKKAKSLNDPYFIGKSFSICFLYFNFLPIIRGNNKLM